MLIKRNYQDDNGDTVLHGNAKVEFYDFRLEEARDLYVKGIESIH